MFSQAKPNPDVVMKPCQW